VDQLPDALLAHACARAPGCGRWPRAALTGARDPFARPLARRSANSVSATSCACGVDVTASAADWNGALARSTWRSCGGAAQPQRVAAARPAACSGEVEDAASPEPPRLGEARRPARLLRGARPRRGRARRHWCRAPCGGAGGDDARLPGRRRSGSRRAPTHSRCGSGRSTRARTARARARRSSRRKETSPALRDLGGPARIAHCGTRGCARGRDVLANGCFPVGDPRLRAVPARRSGATGRLGFPAPEGAPRGPHRRGRRRGPARSARAARADAREPRAPSIRLEAAAAALGAGVARRARRRSPTPARLRGRRATGRALTLDRTRRYLRVRDAVRSRPAPTSGAPRLGPRARRRRPREDRMSAARQLAPRAAGYAVRASLARAEARRARRGALLGLAPGREAGARRAPAARAAGRPRAVRGPSRRRPPRCARHRRALAERVATSSPARPARRSADGPRTPRGAARPLARRRR
jgi:hypothetical protein